MKHYQENMTSSISPAHHMSITSLSSSVFYTNSANIENAFQKIYDSLEASCEKILENKAQKNKTSGHSLKFEESAKKQVTDLAIKLLSSICALRVSDVDTKLKTGLTATNKLMPTEKSLDEIKQLLDKKKKKDLFFNVDKIYHIFKEFYQIDPSVTLYIVLVLEHIIGHFIQLTIAYEEKIPKTMLDTSNIIHKNTIQTLLLAYLNDRKTLNISVAPFLQQFPDDYDKGVKELNCFLSNCLDQMTLIIKVFREPMQVTFPDTADLQTIFGNILGLASNMRILIDSIDDVFESRSTLIGTCFIYPAEDDSFHAYVSYGETVFRPSCFDRLSALMDNPDLLNALGDYSRKIVRTVRAKSKSSSERPPVHTCEWCDGTFEEAAPVPPGSNMPFIPNCNFLINSFKFLLPRLLLLPVFHFLHLVEILEKLKEVTKDDVDGMFIGEVLSMLAKTRTPLQRAVEANDFLKAEAVQLTGFIRTQQSATHNARLAKQKLDEIERMLASSKNWERPSGGRLEFVKEGPLLVKLDRKPTERYIYLFTSFLLICKRVERRIAIGAGTLSAVLKFKKKITLEHINVIEGMGCTEGLDSIAITFTMEYMDEKSSESTPQTLGFVCKTMEEQKDWMATLMYIQTQRLLTKYLRELPKEETPLRLPSPEKYQFAELDTADNIIFEKPSHEPSSSSEIPVIHMATLRKLITRITYHVYYDGKTLSTFLLVFRSFCTPEEVVDLLIERFNIPDPDFTEEECLENACCDDNECKAKQMLKRFRTTYKKRVQLRVLNVLINWLRNPEYYQTDFQSNEELQTTVSQFVNSIDARPLQDGVRNIKKHLLGGVQRMNLTFDSKPPEIIDLNLFESPSDVKLTNVLPLEFARQVTLYEWELYRKIEYWELSGREKTTGPNQQRSQAFSNKFTMWLVYSVVSEHKLDDRVVMLQRIVDLMKIFETLNNTQGAQETKAAIIHGSVFRLHDTINAVMSKSRQYKHFFESLREEMEDNRQDYIAEYNRRIRNLNPPAVPFIAFRQTKLIHIEQGAPNRVQSSEEKEAPVLINFRKCRAFGEIVEYYLSFQRSPYNLTVEPTIRKFLEALDPIALCHGKDEEDFENYAHERSYFHQPKDPSSQGGKGMPPFESSMGAEENILAEQLNNMTFEEKAKDEVCQSKFQGLDAGGRHRSSKASLWNPPRGSGPPSPTRTTSPQNPATSPVGWDSVPHTPQSYHRMQGNHLIYDNKHHQQNHQHHHSVTTPMKASQPSSVSSWPERQSPGPLKPVYGGHQHSMSDSLVTGHMITEDHSASSPPPLPPRSHTRTRETSLSFSSNDTGAVSGSSDVFGSPPATSPPPLPPPLTRSGSQDRPPVPPRQATQRPCHQMHVPWTASAVMPGGTVFFPQTSPLVPHKGDESAPPLPPRSSRRVMQLAGTPPLPPRTARDRLLPRIL